MKINSSLSSLPKKKSEKENSFDYFNTDDTVDVTLNERYSQIRLGFRRSYFCGTIKSVTAFYCKCPIITKELIRFEKVATASILKAAWTLLFLKMLTSLCP